MRKWISAFTLIELLVVIAIIAILAGLLLPALSRAREESRRKACNSNMGQIVKACTTYQEPNGDFFPAFLQGWYTDGNWANINTDYGAPNAIPMQDFQASVNQGNNNNFQPMPSLAVLYPAYVDNVKVFGCPSTSDKPQIAFRYYNGHRHTCFGFTPDPGETGTISGTMIIPGASFNGTPVATWIDPAVFTGNEVSGNAKCSYFYDECTNFRDIGPGQAIAADADGYTWLGINGKHPAYYSPGLQAQEDQNGLMTTVTIGWARPTIPNHDTGQNVMYFDGHVKWSDSVYASRDPNDNIYNPQGCNIPGTRWQNTEWGKDTDAYLWDGTMGDSAAPGQ
jgi:prepilin-type N-terminal cleavage/methylation domain-containing protein/prepilin-type processing-associated H-X9-DG protein